jgi:trans-aconitate methyltransferase
MESDSNLVKSRRKADEGIYLNEDRRENPKEVFKQIGSLIEGYGLADDFSLCDVGCASGDFLYYLSARFPGARLTGFDISPKLTAVAQSVLPDAEFITGSILEDDCLPARHFDIINFAGALSCFDDPEPALLNLLSAIKKGGTIIIASGFNVHPIDVQVRYLRAEHDDSEWESGWNIFSRYTIEKLLRESGYTVEFEWHDLKMPFAIEPSDDPMRAWTTQVGSEPHFRINGACQLLDAKACQVFVKDVP